MMPEVSGETLQRPQINFFLLAVSSLYSRIVLSKLQRYQLDEYRNVERSYYKIIRHKADISNIEIKKNIE